MLKGRLIETGSKREIFEDPHHPYAKFLVSSLMLGEPSEEKETPAAKGVAPSGASEGQGCPFADACPYVMQKCVEKVPGMTRISDTRNVACYLYGGRSE